jgi:hypothetical protein
MPVAHASTRAVTEVRRAAATSPMPTPAHRLNTDPVPPMNPTPKVIWTSTSSAATTATTVAAGLGAAVLLPRLGRVTVQLGLAILAVGFTLLAVTATTATSDTGWLAFLPGVAAIGTIFFSLLGGSRDTTDPAHSYGTAFAITMWASLTMLALTIAVSFLLPRTSSPSS